ncbi:MAG: hypothetical protein ABI600_19190, partial [Luteolibacter sp.]
MKTTIKDNVLHIEIPLYAPRPSATLGQCAEAAFFRKVEGFVAADGHFLKNLVFLGDALHVRLDFLK